MKISLHRKFGLIALSFLMLISSAGFSIDMHYCQGSIQNISFFGKAKSCHEVKNATCHSTKSKCHTDIHKMEEEDNCCHNKKIETKKTDTESTSPQISIAEDFTVDFVMAVGIDNCTIYNYQSFFHHVLKYKPPLSDRDYQVIYQRFLI